MERLVSEWRKAQRDRALTQKDRQGYIADKDAILGLSPNLQCAECIADLGGKIQGCDALIAQYTKQIEELWAKIEERVKKYHALTDERIKFAAQVGESNKAWSDFNNELDGIQSALRRY